MPRVKEWWRGLSRTWRMIIIIVPAMVVLGVGGVAAATGASGYFSKDPSACGNCHIMLPYVQSYYNSDFVDNAHAAARKQVKCTDCHNVAIERKFKGLIKFVTGNYKIPLEQEFQEQESCTVCHQPEQLAERVRNEPKFVKNPKLSYHLSVVAGLECRDVGINVQCQDCHKVHRESVNYCTSCHWVAFEEPPK